MPPVQDAAVASVSFFRKQISSSAFAASMADRSGMLFPGQADGCRRIGGDAFAAPGKAELFTRGRFYADTLGADSGQFGDVCPHGIAVLPNAGGFTHDRKIEVRYATFAGTHAFDGKSEEAVG